jgi:serine protease Do
MTQFFGGDDDLLERFFGGGQRGNRQERPQITQAAGTGFIISAAEGLIITNNHVVENATKIEVRFYGDDEDVLYEATVVGRDPLTDSALIKMQEMPKHSLTEVKFGDSAQMQPGDWVMAIGNPFGLAHTVSVGVVSATERSFPITDGRSADVLQTDAAINPGNSGGPLLNVRGEVVGINTAIYTDSRAQGNIGIGFAIPINTVRELLPQLKNGKVTRGVIGVTVAVIPLDSLDELGLKERTGALVSSVNAGGPASKAGIEPGDVILEFNGKPVKNRDELVGFVTRTPPGTTVPIKVLRDKVEKRLSLTIDELNLDAESTRTARGGRRDDAEPDVQAGEGFGMTLGTLTSEMARRLQLPAGTDGVLITDVEAGSPAQRSGLGRGDVILQVNRRPVTNVADAARELGRVESGSTAFLLVLRNGQELFVTVRKE